MGTNSTALDFSNLIKDWQGNQKYRDLTWSGTFNDYLSLVKENPKVTRNAFQRMYDMITEKGKTEYTDFKKQVVRWKFFDDEENDGKDAVFGLDVPLMKLVNV
jgi:serine protein kinase